MINLIVIPTLILIRLVDKRVTLSFLILLYIYLSYLIGRNTFNISKYLVPQFNFYAVNQTDDLFKQVLLLLSICLIVLKLTPNNKKNINLVTLNNYLHIRVSYIYIFIASLPLIIVFFFIYVPLFQGSLHITKYFQDQLPKFIPFRPFYTFSINALSLFLTVQLNIILNKNISTNKGDYYKSTIIFILLLMTGKRGQLLFPFFVTLIPHSLIYFNFIRSFFTLIIGLGYVIFNSSTIQNRYANNSTTLYLDSLYEGILTSAFVTYRELTRLIAELYKSNELLYGKTYLAGILSFIPTYINPFKREFNYMAYITNLQNLDIEMFGGMRATYIGEALINFDLIGVYIVTIIYSYVIVVFDRSLIRIKSYNYLFLLFFLMKFIFLPFYENGSSMFLFFLITLLTIYSLNFKINLRNNM